MGMSPAGSESVPKLGSPEKEASFGQEAAAAAGGDVAFKVKEEAEAAGGDGAAANDAGKRPKPEEEATANGAAKRPKQEAAAVVDGLKPEEAAAVVDGLKPEEAAAVVDGLKPEEAAVGDGPKAGEEQPPKVPSSVSDEDFEKEFDEEMDQVLLLEKLLSGKKMKKAGEIKKVRVEGDAIKRLLEVRPRNKPMPEFPPLPEDFHLLPADIRRACLSGREKVRELHEYEQYIIDQYDKKGFAEIHSYVFDK